ncbi:hypothetical protein COCCADRAFT_98567, partial [Bipolaris zeicola 26-R-13]
LLPPNPKTSILPPLSPPKSPIHATTLFYSTWPEQAPSQQKTTPRNAPTPLSIGNPVIGLFEPPPPGHGKLSLAKISCSPLLSHIPIIGTIWYLSHLCLPRLV